MAETHWLDEHRDPTEVAVVWSLAAQVVAQHGGDLHGMIWLGRDRTEDRFEDWRPDRLLTGLLETDGGYLEPALR